MVGDRSGIASTLVDAETSVGAEILLGLMRFLGSVPPLASLILGMEGDLRSAAVAASALRCTSIASARGSMLDDGESGDMSPPGLVGALGLFIGIAEGLIGMVGLMGSGMEAGLSSIVGLVGIVRAGGAEGAIGGATRCRESERLGESGLMDDTTGRVGDSSSVDDIMSGMIETSGPDAMLLSSSSAPKRASASALLRRIGLDCSMSVALGTTKVGSSAGNVSGGRTRGDSILSTTAFNRALALAICSLVTRGELATG